jgi:hypothetical protein
MKPASERRRTNRPDDWTALPAEGCSARVPKWPQGAPTDAQRDLWRRLWKLPVAAYWHDVKLEPHVVAGYVAGWIENPLHATVARLASELGLTPAGMQRLRLVVVEPEPVADATADPYAHLTEAGA